MPTEPGITCRGVSTIWLNDVERERQSTRMWRVPSDRGRRFGRVLTRECSPASKGQYRPPPSAPLSGRP